MKKSKHILSLLLVVTPLAAFAHGEEVLGTIFLELIVIVILIVGLVTVNLNRKGKLIIGSIYFLTIVLTFTLTNLLPYRQYQTLTNILVVAVPLTTGIASYMGLKDKFQNE